MWHSCSPFFCRRVLVTLTTAILGSACGESILPPRNPSAIVAASVTGEAARSLDADGLFRLPSEGEGEGPEITREKAKELAAAMWHDAAPFITHIAENDRGAPVHASSLRPCPRAYYAASAYVGVPASAPPVVRKALGPYWLVGMCYGSVQEVVIAVSAYATDARVGSGRIKLEDPGIANFLSMGVPAGAEIPTQPEVIANLVASAAKRPVAVVPRLIMRPRPHGPLVAVWQIAFESPVPVTGRASGKSRSKQTLFAGHLNGWTEPAFADAKVDAVENQRADDALEYRLQRSVTPTRYMVMRREGVPRVLELISFGDL